MSNGDLVMTSFGRAQRPVPAVGRVLLALFAAGLCPAPSPAQVSGGPVVTDSRSGYIDGALPGDQVRLRYDASYNNRRPSRAEFVWAKAADPSRAGVPFPERGVDYQDFSTYLEAAAAERLSVFAELPFRLLNPAVNDNTAGLADINAGLKYAFYASDSLVATFQFRTYVPTADGDRGLGTSHVSLEPALLVYVPVDERWTLEGEFRAWVPVGGTDFAGEVLRYGAGVSYDLWDADGLYVRPVFEVVGWTVLSGKASRTESAAGDTIVNAKLGVRVGSPGRGDVYAGYGRALTGDQWYENTFRLELRMLY